MTLAYAPAPPPPLVTPPSPADDPESWQTLNVGTWSIGPPVAFLIELPGAPLKVDNQKASGIDKAKTKISGVDNTKGSISFRWTRESDDMMFAFMMDVDPNGPNKGKPYDIANPEFALNRVPQIIVAGWKKLERKGDYRERTLEFDEWTEPPKAVAGATTTPTEAEDGTTTIRGFGGNNNTITVPGPVTGWNAGSASAPETSP